MKASRLHHYKQIKQQGNRKTSNYRCGICVRVCVCVLWGHSRHAYEMASSLNRHRGVEAITALAIQHNGLLSPHHQSLSHSTPPTHTPRTTTHTHTHTHTHTQSRRTQTTTHAHSNHTQCDRSLIMPLILSDSGVYNGWFPGAMCQSIHPFIHPSLLLPFIISST